MYVIVFLFPIFALWLLLCPSGVRCLLLAVDEPDVGAKASMVRRMLVLLTVSFTNVCRRIACAWSVTV